MSRQRALWMIGLVSAGLFLFSARTFALEQLGYRVVVADGNFEVRDYPSAMAAEAVRKGSRNSSVNSAFGILADYIFARTGSAQRSRCLRRSHKPRKRRCGLLLARPPTSEVGGCVS